MIQRILSPLSVAALALLLGLGTGPAWYWHKAGGALARAMAVRQQAAAEQTRLHDQQRAHGWDFWTIEMENLASELKEEKARLRKQSDELDKRASRMTADRQELDRLRSDLEGMRREIDLRVIAIKADEAKNLRSLSQTYSNLTPRGAVAIVRELDDSTAVKILSLMKPDVVGPIFEAMAQTPSPDGTLARRAASLSEKLRLMRSGIQSSNVAGGP